MSSEARLIALWTLLAAALGAFAAALIVAAPLFDWQRRLIDMPALPLAAALIAAGLLYLSVWPLIRVTLAASEATRRRALLIVLAAGIGLRLMLLASAPAFEDDWNRYLWDGAVTAHGVNPYTVAPEDAREEEDSPLPALADKAGNVFERINHAHLKTIYPPVAQAAFALAYLMKPFDLTAWRLVCLVAEAATLLLLLALLRRTGRSPLWVALYWLNPLVIKELVNAAHMEAIVTPLVLLAVWLAVASRPLAATAALGLAIGAKLWPVMLAPLLLRPLLGTPRRLAAAVLVLGAMTVLWALPPWLGEIDETSGFTAYATHWQTSNALLPWLVAAITWVLSPLGLAETVPGLVVRAGLGGLMLAFALWQARAPVVDATDLLRRVGRVTLALLLASPAQFPWYLAWTLPFAVVQPLAGLMAATMTLPVYYIGFHYIATEQYWIYQKLWVWAIWLPVWAALVVDLRQGRLGSAPPAARGD